MTTNPQWLDPNMSLAQYFEQMQGTMPQPVNYQPPTESFNNLMSGFGEFNPTAQPTATATPAQPTTPPTFGDLPAAEEGGTSPGYGVTPSWGPFSQFPFPTNPEATADMGQWAFWAQDPKAVEPLKNFSSFMQPWLSQLQDTYQYSQDFGEAQRRYDQDAAWSQYADQFSMDLNARQQQAYELQQQLQNQQWLEEFGRTAQNDQFSQAMALQNLMLNQARLAQQAEASRYQAFGRSSRPGRFSASWG